MTQKFDAVVIGSGFGGAITACRLAQKGMKVLILERGKWWSTDNFPRHPEDSWEWDPISPQRNNGWFDIRFFKNMAVAMGAGVGGGSLVYANVSVEARPEMLDAGWPAEINSKVLAPYYQEVGKMLNVQTIPDNQLTRRFQLMQESAEKEGAGERFRKLPLALNFSQNWHYGLDDPFTAEHSESFVNDQALSQGTCVHCGNCVIGCTYKARNTLDFNYIPLAQVNDAKVYHLHLVSHIEKKGNEYVVYFKRIHNGSLYPGKVGARIVVLAAGSLGSTEILLRSRHEYKTLPKISDYLGKNWSPNGDFLTPGFYDDRKVSPSQGPTITCAIDYLDGVKEGLKYFIEDGGFPDLLGNYLERKLEEGSWDPRFQVLLDGLGRVLRKRDPFENLMPWFAQGIDNGGGRMHLKRTWYAPWRQELYLDWDPESAKPVIDGIVRMHQRLSKITGGKAWVPPPWEHFNYLITPHPLGGCNMGTKAENGVVNHLGQVFNYPNLYVADGAIIPRPIGLNPSRTIAALAERIAKYIE